MPKLLNKVNLPQYGSAPSSPVQGDMYYNTTDDTVYTYNGTSWLDLAAGGGGSGDITDVVAGAGLTGGATSGSATLNVGAGTGITVNADDVAIDTTVVARKTDNLGAFATSTSAAIGVGSIELGNATDTTLTRSAAGKLAVEGVDVQLLSYETTATASQTTTLTNASANYQYFTGSTSGQIVQLPVASTMTLGQWFEIVNISTASLLINSSGGNSVITLYPSMSVRVACILTSGTTAASWDAKIWSGRATGTATTGTGPNLVFSQSPTITNPLFSTGAQLNATQFATSTVATAAGTTTLSTTSSFFQRFTGTSTQTVTLPASMANYGQAYVIQNFSTGDVTVNASGGQNVVVVKTNQQVLLHATSNGPTTAALWDVIYLGAPTYTGTGASVYATSPSLTTPSLGVATATSINGTTIPSSATLVTTGDTGSVTSAMIADGTIVDADINASAGIAISKLGTSTTSAIGVGSIELGHASDTTLSRSSAGVVAVEGTALVKTDDSRLSDARTPTAHATSHKSGGTDSIKLNELANPDGNISLNNNKITGLATPSADSDAVTKAYVDGVAQGLDIKASVRAATTVPITLSGTQTIDGVSLLANDRVLVKDQSSAVDNGIYVVSASTWSRADDAAQNGEITPGTFVFVEEGTTNADSGWVMTSNGTITIGSTAMAWSQFSGAGQIVAGTGISKSGNTLSVNNTVVPTISGSNTVTFTAGATTALTLPASGTVATTSNDLGAFTASTTAAVGVGTIDLGHASDTTIARSSAGTVTIEGKTVATSDNTLTLTNKTLTDSTTTFQDEADNSKKMQFQLSGITTNQTRTLTVPDSSGTIATLSSNLGAFSASTTAAIGVGTIELGNASDTTIARSQAGVISVEGVDVLTTSGSQTVTNKTISASNNTISGLAKVYYQTTVPTGGTYAAGDIWIDSDDDTAPNTNALNFIQRVSNYTLASDLSDYPDRVIEMDLTSANTVTVPTNATAAYPIGTQIHILQINTGQTSIAAAVGVTINSPTGLKLKGQWSMATIIKRNTNVWVAVGDLTA